MLTVGIIGYGTIGKDIVNLIQKRKAGNVELTSILVRQEGKINDPLLNCIVTVDENTFFNQNLDIIIEAAGHQSITLYGERALLSGSDLIILSVGALADNTIYTKLHNAAQTAGKQMIFPSAAIAGLDRIAAATAGEMEEIRLVTRKQPKSWYGTIAEKKVDLANVKESVCIFEGNARDAAILFPENVNVSAALSLAGIGFEQTKVEVYVDPTINKNSHTIFAKGHFGEVTIEVQNTPAAENPKSSPIVAMSVAKTLRNLTTPIFTGI